LSARTNQAATLTVSKRLQLLIQAGALTDSDVRHIRRLEASGRRTCEEIAYSHDMTILGLLAYLGDNIVCQTRGRHIWEKIRGSDDEVEAYVVKWLKGGWRERKRCPDCGSFMERDRSYSDLRSYGEPDYDHSPNYRLPDHYILKPFEAKYFSEYREEVLEKLGRLERRAIENGLLPAKPPERPVPDNVHPIRREA
jgi:hypothetical protein